MNKINDVIQYLNSGNFDDALRELKTINIDNSNNNQLIRLFAFIYLRKKDWENSIKYYAQILAFDSSKFKIHNIIGIALFNLGKINQSIEAYKKSIIENSNFDLAYNNLAISYLELGNLEEAANNFAHALNLNKDNHEARENLINIFMVIDPKNINLHPLIKINSEIRNIDNKININYSINLKDIKKVFYESENIIKNNYNNFISNETQIYRKNSLSLNCKRHFKIFNEFNIIPKFCFGCYKIQINLKNVVDLIKLFFVFDSLNLEKNNIRKCIIETRKNIAGNYKGYIYCDGLNEAEIILKKINKIINKIKFEGIKTIIKHGCTEFYESYPDYQKIRVNNEPQMKYDQNWQQKEKIIDNRSPVRVQLDKKKQLTSLKGINLSDILIIKNWLNYADVIGDFSYKKIYDKDLVPSFINKILESQLDFRKQDHLRY